MAENIKVSIVVPVYNTGQYLPRCLKSICNQTLKEIEIILVDDGSDDDSGEICDNYAAEDVRIRVIHKLNGGLVSARQAGLAAATGEFTGFVDSDDWIESGMYQILYEMAVCNKADIAVEGIIDEIDNRSWKRENRLQSGRFETIAEKEKLYKSMISCENFFCLGIQPYLCNKLIRRKLAIQHMNRIPQLIQIGEDAAAVYPMLVQANAIVISDTVHYHYCHRNTSMMQGKIQEDKEYANAMLLHSFLKKMFRELGVYNVMQDQLQRYAVNNLLTRVYGKYAKLDKESILFPFENISQEDSIIIYGAGAFGKAVYQYATSYKDLRVKAWIDQRAVVYQSFGWNVHTLEDVAIECSDKIIVAVFREFIYWQIKKKLIAKGATLNQIKWIDMEKLSNWPIMSNKFCP